MGRQSGGAQSMEGVKRLNKGKNAGKNRFKFQSFAEQIDKIQIDVHRDIGGDAVSDGWSLRDVDAGL